MRVLFSLALCALAVGTNLTAESVAFAQSEPQAPGKMIDVGGYKLYLDCRGAGSPTVILDNGLGGVSSEWALVQPEVARFTRVCSYDRAYDGFSDAGPIPRTMHRQAFELHRLLLSAHLTPPVLLVGTSIGGFLDQVYKSVYSSEVGGMVLIDSTSVDIVMGGKRVRSQAVGSAIPAPQTLEGKTPPAYTAQQRKMLEDGSAQLAKEAESPLQPPLDKIPADVQPLWRWEHSHTRLSPDFRDWQKWWAEEMESLHREREGKEHVYGEMPLIVLGAESSTIDAERLRQLYDMVQMSTDALLLIDPHSGHRMQLEVPQLVTHSIEELVEGLRMQVRLDTLQAGLSRD